MPAGKTTKPRAAAPAAKTDPEVDLIRGLADILNDTGLSEIQLERKGVKIRVSRSVTVTASVAPAVHHAAPVHAAPAPAATPAPAAAASKGPDADHPGTVKSPMVGTVYRAATPGASPFVEIGTEVKEGQTLLIIEAMKTMNQIPAPRGGKVTHIFVDNGQPVEYGEALVIIE